MPAPPRGRARSRLMLLVLTAVTLLTLDFRGFGPLDSAQGAARDALAPVRSGIDTATSPFQNAGRGLFGYGDLKAENRRLQAEIEDLKGQQIQGEIDAETYKLLREQNDIPYIGDLPRVTARVISGSIGNFDAFSVEIDKGTSAGIDVGMPVVTAAGMVGRITQADRTRSRMELITSPQFTVGVRLGQGQEVTLARGTGAGNPLRTTGGLNIDAPVESGDLARTHSQARGVFPADIPVGRVTMVDRASGATIVDIEPSANLDSLDFVVIILFEGEK